MTNEIYTAQEMRDMADFFVRNAEMVRQKVLSNAILANIHESIPMLRYAAEVITEKKRIKESTMTNEIYTAQEMRDMADFFVRNAEMVRQKVLSNAILANIHESIPMLRYAAEVMERCENLKLNMIPHRHDKELVDYIIRGDEGKEEK